MPTFDSATAECLVFTYKEGLLSAIAHDLKLVVSRFTVEVEESPLRVRFTADATSLRVGAAMQAGREAPQLLSDADRQKIERNIVAEVLGAARFPRIEFSSTRITAAGRGFEVVGLLTLHGQSRELRLVSEAGEGTQRASVQINQTDFGILPYSAMLGTLRIRPQVTVQLTLPWSAPARP